ncbi:hypothetical protein NE865_05714 [Phthorimaea operculella]|nr:hypothetical protein NE865_05714 [Phthorimaea operculella]
MWGLLFFIVSVHSVLGDGKGFINFGGFICPREEKALGECLKDALNSYIPQLASGVPEFNVPSSEPLIIPSLSVRQHSGPIDVTSTFDDVTVSGPSHMTVTDVNNVPSVETLIIPSLSMRQHSGPIDVTSTFDDVTVSGQVNNVPSVETLIIPSLSMRQHSGPIDVTSTFDDVTVSGQVINVPSSEQLIPSLSVRQHSGPIDETSTFDDVTVRVIAKKHQVIARLAIPELKMRGNYKLAGQLLMLPIEGQGKFTAKFGDIDAIVNIVLGRQRQFNGPDTLKCEELDFKFKATSASMQLDNLFGSDGELSKSMNSFLNENWQMMAEELQGPIEDALRDFFKPLADHSFATLNADDIFGKH